MIAGKNLVGGVHPAVAIEIVNVLDARGIEEEVRVVASIGFIRGVDDGIGVGVPRFADCISKVKDVVLSEPGIWRGKNFDPQPLLRDGVVGPSNGDTVGAGISFTLSYGDIQGGRCVLPRCYVGAIANAKDKVIGG